MNGSNERNTALVVGAGGGIGGEVARRLARAGWRVRGLKRGLAAETVDADGIAWMTGDAMERADVARAAQGCAVIVHAVNPPGYRDWGKLVLPMLRNTISAAAANGALVVLPGTVYNYGPDAFPVVAEDAPQHPATRKGDLRVQMEAALEAHAAGGGRVLVVRAGDFFGPRAGNNWFAQGLIKPGKPVGRIANPAAPGAGHQWAYLPDVAATMVALIERRADLAPFARFHMQGHWDPDGTAMCDAIRRAVERRGGRAGVGAFPWWLVRLATPFNETLRELWEMRYLWRQPVCLDNRRLVGVLGAEPHTPLDEAVERTLEGLGCLPAPVPVGGAAAIC
ncbi:NAD-dependent epimerase/dehydratase family protein [Massilia rhizosphaerae]|uniref:NAD-dependent epimerase/dehydratase family protein n=1 Tax=Massilia rhizosphaerae TaxID=2784389 RepID=UPI0018DD9702|nr:NAD-dependent epimerase/dehydratase family protein [Massilia rhizosphaerae]